MFDEALQSNTEAEKRKRGNNRKKHREKCRVFSKTLRGKIQNCEYFITKQKTKTLKQRRRRNTWRKYGQIYSVGSEKW